MYLRFESLSGLVFHFYEASPCRAPRCQVGVVGPDRLLPFHWKPPQQGHIPQPFRTRVLTVLLFRPNRPLLLSLLPSNLVSSLQHAKWRVCSTRRLQTIIENMILLSSCGGSRRSCFVDR